jgi:hypothetical protein
MQSIKKSVLIEQVLGAGIIGMAVVLAATPPTE